MAPAKIFTMKIDLKYLLVHTLENTFKKYILEQQQKKDLLFGLLKNKLTIISRVNKQSQNIFDKLG